MYKKPIFTPKEMHDMFNKTDAQKYNTIKKDIAKIIIRYLLANHEIKTNNEEVYEKAIILQSKNMLYNPTITTLEQAAKIADMTALSDIELMKGNYTDREAMQLILNLFLSIG